MNLKMLLVFTILLAIGYTKSSALKSCQLYTIQHFKLIKFHNQRIQKIMLGTNFIGENVNICLSLHPNGQYYLNSIHLSLIKAKNKSISKSPTVFYKRWHEFDLRNTRINNQLCIRYKNPQNFKLSVQLEINVKQTGKNLLAIRDLKLCYTQAVRDRIKRSFQIWQSDMAKNKPWIVRTFPISLPATKESITTESMPEATTSTITT